MSKQKKAPAKKPSPSAKKPAAKTGQKRGGQQARNQQGKKKQGQRTQSRQKQPQQPSLRSRLLSGGIEWARWLWGTVTALLIAAMLFEPTMLWCLSVGLWMVAETEFIGLWMVAAGYVMACLPWAFGLLIATGRFWTSLTHSLWIGFIYAALGYIFLDRILGVFS